MIHDNESSNKSGNRPFHDVLQARISRRNVLARGAALSATGFLAALAGDLVLDRGTVAETGRGSRGAATQARSKSLINFTPLAAANSVGLLPTISSDYQFEVLIPCGTSIQPGGSEYNGDPNTRPTADQQTQQIGIGHDGMWFFPIGNANDRGLLAINHEYGTNKHLLGNTIFPKQCNNDTEGWRNIL